jgi:hypothetical protein
MAYALHEGDRATPLLCGSLLGSSRQLEHGLCYTYAAQTEEQRQMETNIGAYLWVVGFLLLVCMALIWYACDLLRGILVELRSINDRASSALAKLSWR